jgi:hypothetical protein
MTSDPFFEATLHAADHDEGIPIRLISGHSTAGSQPTCGRVAWR